MVAFRASAYRALAKEASMPRDLFGDVTDPSVKVGSRKWYAVPVSLAFHTVAVLIVFIVPLMATGALPVPHAAVIFVPVALAPLPAPPPVHRADAPKPAVNKHAAPIETPDTIAREPEFEIEVANPAASGLHEIGIVEGGTALIAPPPPPPARIDTPIRPGGDIKPPEKIRDVAPIYPPIAQAAHAQGTVIIEAVIGVDGRVQDARVLRSAPLLDEAALAAVRQWLYTPTRLNGQPVSVVMTVTVRFQLQ
jgi:periplasmic protein TonB